jgi:ethanolamine ammonia-lyase large subunit
MKLTERVAAKLYDARQITRAGLEDHFCGKLPGVPIRRGVGHTKRAHATRNFFMVLPMSHDVDDSSTRFWDPATPRQPLGPGPAPEMEPWLGQMGWTGLMNDRQRSQPTDDPSIIG